MSPIEIDLKQEEIEQSSRPEDRKRKFIKFAKVFGVFLVSFLILGYIFAFRPAMALRNDLYALYSHSTSLEEAVKAQNLTELEKELDEIDRLIKSGKTHLSYFRWTLLLPKVGRYYKDANLLFEAGLQGIEGGKILTKGLEPLADIFGFYRTKERGVEVSAEGKIPLLVKAIPKIIPSISSALEKLKKAGEKLEQVNPAYYPENFKGIAVQTKLIYVKELIKNGEKTLADLVPLLETSPSILGAESPKTYLVLFQNDKELRPTGGFLTAYALVSFDNGKFSVVDSDDIYQLDPKVGFLPIPAPILYYLKAGSEWFMRDTNWSPDFKESMEDFEYYYKRTVGPAIDGIIGIDTQFAENFLKVTGPVELTKYGETFDAENVVVRLEEYAELIGRGAGRKDILGDLMEGLVDRVLKAPKDEWPDLLKTSFTQTQEKHILFYFHDENLQSFFEKRNWAGRISDFKKDYLHINNTNLASAKSNLYMTYDVDQLISINAEGTITKKLTITYTNTGKYDGWLNATNRNWLRIYVPKGAQLLKMTGGEIQAQVYEDLEKTVFATFVLTPPLSTTVLEIEYQLPFKLEGDEYEILIQKQPGTNRPEYVIKVGDKIEEFELNGDKEVGINL